MHPDWENFVIVVVAQVVALLLTIGLVRGAARPSLNQIWVSLACGLGIGAVFDTLVGRSQGVFRYELPLTGGFVVANGALSYGIALLNAVILPVPMRKTAGSRRRQHLALGAVAMLAAGIALTMTSGALASAIATGLLVIAVGEVLIAARGLTGPMSGAIFGCPRAFIALWSASAALGLAYELVNHWFPVWRWDLLPPGNDLLTMALIVFAGYFVLFHALTTLAVLLFGRTAALVAE